MKHAHGFSMSPPQKLIMTRVSLKHLSHDTPQLLIHQSIPSIG